jgi:preprotein translocase SecE subunit
VARDRKRAKQRRARARPPAPSSQRSSYTDAAAALGQPAAEPPRPPLEELAGDTAVPAELDGIPGADPVVVPEDEDAHAEVFEDELDGAVPPATGLGDDEAPLPAVAAARRPAQQPRSGNRVVGFLRASWAELQRVQWPDRRQVAQATAVVLGFVVIAGAFLGFADYVAQKIVDAVL